MTYFIIKRAFDEDFDFSSNNVNPIGRMFNKMDVISREAEDEILNRQGAVTPRDRVFKLKHIFL